MAEYPLLSTGCPCASREEMDSTVYHADRGQRHAAHRSGPAHFGHKNADSPAAPGLPESARAPWGKRRKIDPAMVLVVGLGAGVISAAAQLALWALAGMPVFETLLRDARLTAAVILGEGVLPPPSTPRWDILLAATLIHFALSIAYALVPAYLIDRLTTLTAIVGGACYGLAIYAINMYGFTLLFPWFAVARDWVTLVTHLVFGATLAWGCLLCARRFREPPK